jgi:hypothetical protein
VKTGGSKYSHNIFIRNHLILVTARYPLLTSLDDAEVVRNCKEALLLGVNFHPWGLFEEVNLRESNGRKKKKHQVSSV